MEFKYSGVILQFKRDGVINKRKSKLVPCAMLWLEGRR
jgi:hypothetical protein